MQSPLTCLIVGQPSQFLIRRLGVGLCHFAVKYDIAKDWLDLISCLPLFWLLHSYIFGEASRE